VFGLGVLTDMILIINWCAIPFVKLFKLRLLLLNIWLE